MGRLAKIARSLLGVIPLNARLCVISWMARKRLWFAVPPIAYAQKMKVNESGDVRRRRMARDICRKTTVNTIYLVQGSCPINLVTFKNVNEKNLLLTIQHSLLDALS